MFFTTQYDVFLFDCDGVVWKGGETIPGAPEVIKTLVSLGKTVIFVTNNTSTTLSAYLQRFKDQLGVCLSKDQIYSSGIATSHYVQQKLLPNEKVFLIGSQGLSRIMDEVGVKYIGYDDKMNTADRDSLANYVPDEQVKIVVGAFDCCYNYNKMAKAFVHINECGAEYVATNLDMNHALADGRLLPGTGAVLEGLSQSLGITPKVLGKPSSDIFKIIHADHKIPDKSRVLMIGDSLKSDIQFGINAGVDTVLVLSGITSRRDVDNQDFIKPTYIIDSIVNLLDDDR